MTTRTTPEGFLKRLRSFLTGHVVVVALVRFGLMMVLYSLCRFLFYWWNRDLFPGMDTGRLAMIVWGGMRFDVAGLLYLNAIVLMAMVIPLKVRFHRRYQRTVLVIFLVVNALGLFTNLSDMVYYRTTLRRTTSLVMDQFSHETNFAQLIPQFLMDFSGVLFIYLLMLALLIWLSIRLRVEGPKTHHPGIFYGGGALLMLLAVGLMIGGVRGGFRHSTRPITVSNAMAYAAVPEDVALVVNTPFSLLRTATTGIVRKVSYFPDEESLRNVYDPEFHPAPTGEFQPMNVVVIIVESLSMEFSGFYNRDLYGGSYQGYTPFLDSLASQSVTWRNGFANGRKSIEAMPSVLCGLPSAEVPFVLSHYSNNRVNSLPSLLKPKGYHSAFFHGAPNGSMGFDAFARQAGFDQYFGMTEYGNSADMDGIWGIWDLPFLQFFAGRLSEMPEPFCAAVFTVSSHHPFEVPEEYEGEFRPGETKMHEAVQYTDLALRRFFERVSREPWFDRTLFVLTADHVSSEVTLPEYKTSWGKYAVPILFYSKNMLPLFDTLRTAQQTDILPSVLSRLNYDKPFVAFGKDLFSAGDSTAFNYAAPAYQLMTSDGMLQHDGKEALGFYDYRVDRRMQRNILEGQPKEIRTVLEGQLKARIQQYNNRMVEDRLVIR